MYTLYICTFYIDIDVRFQKVCQKHRLHTARSKNDSVHTVSILVNNKNISIQQVPLVVSNVALFKNVHVATQLKSSYCRRLTRIQPITAKTTQ